MLTAIWLAACSRDQASDEPEGERVVPVGFVDPGTYEEALATWQTPEQVSEWIGATFTYDSARAMRLSETQRKKDGGIPIYTPAELFGQRTGVCVDLARFGVETLRAIGPELEPKYLMMEFDPLTIGTNTLRFHWVVSFRRDGGVYVLADSKRPGHLAGPYADVQQFVDAYAGYRERTIVAFRETDTYQKQKQERAQATRQQR